VTTDRIEEEIVLPAPRARVWRALADPQEFGAWFGVRFGADTVFAPGATPRGHVTHPGYEHLAWEVTIEEVVAESRLAWRWHPYAVDADVDYSAEPTTLVTFTLDDAPDGTTRLTVVESGFDALPPERRGLAFEMNRGGWEAQVRQRLPAYVGGGAEAVAALGG
jgi:uncharacterized protein YndB with AHSA1/START domain